jgi:hypothetical protein
MKEDFITVPTWDNGVWTTTSFATREDFRLYLLTLFKEPGEYECDETALRLSSSEKRRYSARRLTEVRTLSPIGMEKKLSVVSGPFITTKEKAGI